MINSRTLKGLQAALRDCVPGRAQRRRLLEALARVPGNRTISAAMTELREREEESSPKRRENPEPVPRSGLRIRAQVISYTQAASEVNLTLDRPAAERLLRALDDASFDSSGTTEAGRNEAVQGLRFALEGALAGRAA